ncbi:MAG: protein kinase domain-containing protein [Microcoleus sp.]
MIIPELSAGTSIADRYLIDRTLGQGGFGRTYLAFDKQQGNRSVVLKEFAPGNMKPQELKKARELFDREANILSKLNHDRIPKFLNWFEENDRLFIVQEFVNGKTYWHLLQSKTFSETEIVQWLKDMLDVLAYIHGQGIIHRDISPDNMMLPQGKQKPVLIDFGVVKYAQTKLTTGNPGVSHVHQPTSVGKEVYAPLEQLRGGECYPNSDLYSLAVTAIVLLTGKEPKNLIDYNAQWHWRSHVNVSDKLAEIIDRMLQEKPSDRYQSARDVLNAINNSKTSEKTTMSSPETKLSSDPGLPPTQLSSGSSNYSSNYGNSSHPANDPGNQQARTANDRTQWKKIALIAVPITLLLSGIAALEAPRIGFLCGPLNNCAADKPFNETYNSGVSQADAARVLGQNAQTVDELEAARDRMKSAIDRLSSIPPTAKVYPDTQKLLPAYQSELSAMSARLTREQQAEKLLEEAEAIATDAPKETDLTKQKALWMQAADKLKAIAADSLIADKVKTRSAEFDRQIQELETAIRQSPSPEPPSAAPSDPAPSSPAAAPDSDYDLFKPPSKNSDGSTPAPQPTPSPAVPDSQTPNDDNKPLF